jgi:hypothetical protein
MTCVNAKCENDGCRRVASVDSMSRDDDDDDDDDDA